MSKMQADLGLAVLPREYGGTNSSTAELTQFWLGEMENKWAIWSVLHCCTVVLRRDWLLQQPTYKTDEARRPGKPKLHSDIFGIEGSFRKLEID